MRHLKPGGWVIIGEPSLLHLISPEARRVTREEGIIERGLTAHSIKKDLKNCGFQNLKRYYEGTHPYNSKISGFLWQLIRLIGANFVFAPQSSVWCIAQKPEHSKK